MIIILILSFQVDHVGAAELELPNIVVPRKARLDVIQPFYDLEIESDWTFHPPRFRRIYRLPVSTQGIIDTPEPSPESLKLPLHALTSLKQSVAPKIYSSGFIRTNEPIMINDEATHPGELLSHIGIYKINRDGSVTSSYSWEYING